MMTQLDVAIFLRVGIVGVGQTKFGKLSDSSSRELVGDAFKQALSDAGLDRKDVSTLIVCSGSHYDKQRSPAGIMAEYHLDCFPVSSATGKGIEELKTAIARRLRELAPAPVEAREETPAVPEPDSAIVWTNSEDAGPGAATKRKRS